MGLLPESSAAAIASALPEEERRVKNSNDGLSPGERVFTLYEEFPAASSLHTACVLNRQLDSFEQRKPVNLHDSPELCCTSKTGLDNP